MTNQQILNRAKDRYHSNLNLLFLSELKMVDITMYDLDLNLPATAAEKIKLAKAMSLAEIDRTLTHTKQEWFSKRKVQRLLREKQALLHL